MQVSSHDAAVMYARACRAWYGKRAAKVATEQIRKLKRSGDTEGVAMWTKVADRLSELNADAEPELRGKLY